MTPHGPRRKPDGPHAGRGCGTTSLSMRSPTYATSGDPDPRAASASASKNAAAGLATPSSSLMAMTSTSKPSARSSAGPRCGLIGDTATRKPRRATRRCRHSVRIEIGRPKATGQALNTRPNGDANPACPRLRRHRWWSPRRTMTAPRAAMKVSRGTPRRSAQSSQTRVSSMKRLADVQARPSVDLTTSDQAQFAAHRREGVEACLEVVAAVLAGHDRAHAGLDPARRSGRRPTCAKTPSSNSPAASCCALFSSPAMTGVIGVSRDPVSKPRASAPP